MTVFLFVLTGVFVVGVFVLTHLIVVWAHVAPAFLLWVLSFDIYFVLGDRVQQWAAWADAFIIFAGLLLFLFLLHLQLILLFC